MSSDPPSPRKSEDSLKSYGRQGKGKTIKSLSLDKELVRLAEAKAKEQGVSFSQFVNQLLADAAPVDVTSTSEPAKGSRKKT